MTVIPKVEILTASEYNLHGVDSMSLVIMMKCTDGIVCCTDSRMSIRNGELPPIDTVRKIFASDKLIVAPFGNYTIWDSQTQSFTLPSVIKNIIENVNTVDELCKRLQQSDLESAAEYTMFVGWKDSSGYQTATVVIRKDKYEILLSEYNPLFSEPRGVAYKNLITEQEFSSDRSAKVLGKIVENLINIQNEFQLNPSVGGKVQTLIWS